MSFLFGAIVHIQLLESTVHYYQELGKSVAFIFFFYFFIFYFLNFLDWVIVCIDDNSLTMIGFIDWLN